MDAAVHAQTEGGGVYQQQNDWNWLLLMWHHTHVGDLIKFRSDHMFHLEPAEAQEECLVTTPEWNSIYPKLPSATKAMGN